MIDPVQSPARVQQNDESIATLPEGDVTRIKNECLSQLNKIGYISGKIIFTQRNDGILIARSNIYDSDGENAGLFRYWEDSSSFATSINLS